MRPSPKLRPNGWDALVVLLVAVLAAGCAGWLWLPRQDAGGPLTAVVSMDGATVERLPLGTPAERTYIHNGYTLHVKLTETEVWVDAADCPTQDCVHTGRISRSGQSIVCLPARIIILLEGKTDGGGVDAVIG